MAKYYFVGTLLPALSFDAPPEISFSQLDTLLRDNLTKCDFEKTLVIRRFYDILNLRSLWLEEDLDPKGAFSVLELDEALDNRFGLPDYVYEFVEKYQNKEDRLRHFSWLLAKFFQSSVHLKDPFLKEYMNFEREIRLIMTAFRAKKLGRELSVELQFENPEEEFIAQLLAHQDAKGYEPPEKYRELKIIFEKYGDNPMALQKQLDEYRFNKVESMVNFGDVFSIDQILAYFIQYLLVKRWSELDKVKGNQIINAIAKEPHHGANG